MGNKVFVAAIVAAAVLITTACSGSALSGQAVDTGPATPSSSPSSTAASPAAARVSPSTPAATVTVTSTPHKPNRPHTVTKEVQAPAPVPHSGSALEDLVDSNQVAAPSEYSTSDGDAVFFDAPSQNIGCFIYNDGSVACAIHNYDFPQDGPDCDGGIGADLDSGGYPSLTTCSGYFSVAGRGNTLSYGWTIYNGDTGCASESTGVSCVNRDYGTGFTLSKEAFTPVS